MPPNAFGQADAPPLAADQLPEPLPADPFFLVADWYAEAHRKGVQPNPNAMTLATVDPDGRPSARIMLCKDIDPKEGSVVFFTNYESRKSHALGAHPWATLVFHWDSLGHQVRIEGPIVKTPAPVSDAYFATRPWESCIGAWSSNQSRPIGSRKEMLDRVDQTMRRFGLDPARPPAPGSQVPIPRPPHWGGYCLVADRVELWVSGRGRLHDRASWNREVTQAGAGFTRGPWRATRVQP